MGCTLIVLPCKHISRFCLFSFPLTIALTIPSVYLSSGQEYTSQPDQTHLHALHPLLALQANALWLRPPEIEKGSWLKKEARFSACASSSFSGFTLEYCFSMVLEQTLLHSLHLPRLDMDIIPGDTRMMLSMGKGMWRSWSDIETARQQSQQGMQQSSLLLLPTCPLLGPFPPWLTEKAASQLLKANSKAKLRDKNSLRKQRPRYAATTEGRQEGDLGPCPGDFSLHWGTPCQQRGSTAINSSPAFHLWVKSSLTSWEPLRERFSVPLKPHCQASAQDWHFNQPVCLIPFEIHAVFALSNSKHQETAVWTEEMEHSFLTLFLPAFSMPLKKCMRQELPLPSTILQFGI